MSQITIRPGEEEDQKRLIHWLSKPEALQWFPLQDLREIEDAARIWMSYIKQGAVLTALVDGVACGTANLYLQPFKKLAHQSLFAIIVDEAYRGKGVGTALMQSLIKLAKEKFKLELLHLEVYEHNPAIRLYEKLGFIEYGRHRNFIKDNGKYITKILMQRKL